MRRLFESIWQGQRKFFVWFDQGLPAVPDSAQSPLNAKTRRLMLAVCFLALILGSLVPLSSVLIDQYQPNGPQNFEDHFAQINTDQSAYIDLITHFPYWFQRDVTRINRPLYPAFSSLLCRGFKGVSDLFAKETKPYDPTQDPYHLWGPPQCSRLQARAAAVVLNTLVLLFGVFVGFFLLRRWGFSQLTSFIAVSLLALSGYSAFLLFDVATNYNAIFTDLTLLSILTLFLSRRLALWKILGIGLGIGTLMLMKTQYDMLAFFWVVLLLKRRFRELLGTLAVHIIPLSLYKLWLSLYGIAYYNYDTQSYNFGTWLLNDFLQQPFTSQLGELLQYWVPYLNALQGAFGWPTLTFASFGVFVCVRRGYSKTLLWASMGILANYAFSFAAIKRALPYLMFNTFYVVFPLAALGISTVLAWGNFKRVQALVLALLVLTCSVFNTDSFMPPKFHFSLDELKVSFRQAGDYFSEGTVKGR